jgi:hypothetical protein
MNGDVSGGIFYDSSGTLTWTAPSGGGVTDYVVEVKLTSETDSSPNQWRRYATRPSTTSLNVVFEVGNPQFAYGGTPNSSFGNGGGLSYSFRVAASNASGLSGWLSGTWNNQDGCG